MYGTRHGVFWWSIVTAAVISRPLRRILAAIWIILLLLAFVALYPTSYATIFHYGKNLSVLHPYWAVPIAVFLHIGGILGIASVFVFIMWFTAIFLAILSWFAKRDWNRFFRTPPIKD